MKNPTVVASIKEMVAKHNKYYTDVEPKASKRVHLELVNGSAKFTAAAALEGNIQHWAYESGKVAWEEAIKASLEKYTGKLGKNKVSIEKDGKYFRFALVVTGPTEHAFKALEIIAAPGGEDGRDKSDPVMVVKYKSSDQMTDVRAEKKINFKDAYSAETSTQLKKKTSEILDPIAKKSLDLAESYLDRMAEKNSKVTIKM